MPPKGKYEATWQMAQKALQEVNQVLRASDRELVDVSKISECKKKLMWYDAIYKTCTDDMKSPELLHDALRRWVKQDLQTHVTMKAKQIVEDGNTDKLFKYVADSYRQYKQLERFACLTFGYLDQYLAKKPGFDKVTDIFAKEYHHAVYQNIKVQLVNAIVKNITEGRLGNRLDKDAVRNCVGIFINVGTAVYNSDVARARVFSDDFESHYIAAIETFYKERAAQKWNEEGGHYSYLQWVESYWRFEDELAKDILKQDSLKKVHDKMQEVLLKPFMNECICHVDSGLRILMEDGKRDEAHRMFTLFSEVPNHEATKIMQKEVSVYVQERGKQIWEDFSNSEQSSDAKGLEKTVIDSCVALFKEIGDWLTRQFGNNSLIQEARKTAFETFFNVKLERTETVQDKKNVRTTVISEVLCNYLDAVMRNELKDITDSEEELERLDHLATLFSHIREKDVFQEYYKAKLAKRLLQTTPNEDLEKAFIEKLQRMMSKSFTHKMEGMLRDRESTSRLSDEFQNEDLAKNLGDVTFSTQVLSACHWPSYKADSLVTVDSLSKCIKSFTLFYKKKFATRLLSWIHMLGSGTLSVAFPKGKKDVNASTYQANIILLIDERQSMTVAEISEQLKLDGPKVVKPTIASMYLSKAFPLLVGLNEDGSPMAQPDRKLPDTLRLSLNKTFTHKTRRFKLPPPTHAAKEGMPTDNELESRRRIQIDACVVRVMKSRRTLDYNELMDLCITQLTKTFTPQPRMIKTRVEDLITRGYLKRDEDTPSRFHYLA